jgi:hypothetical protein
MKIQSFTQHILEHWTTTDNHDVKSKHHDVLHKMIKSSYKHIGGYGALGHSPALEDAAISHDIMHPDHVIKMKSVKGVPHAVSIYRKMHGLKRIVAATNGTQEGVHHLHKIIQDDNKFNRSWSETSGAMQHLSKKYDVPTISNTRAEELTGHKIHKVNPDNTYDRTIGHATHTKQLFGHLGNNWVKTKSGKSDGS